MPLTNQVDLLPNQGWDDRILLAQNGDLVTVAIIVTTRYVVMVDTLLNPTTARALLDIARPHLHGSRQLLVVNTHADWDHAWGNQLFAGPQAGAPAPILAHAEVITQFDHPGTAADLMEFRQQHPGIFDDVVLTKPTLTFTGELTIDGGDLTLRLLPTPGHTPDHIALYLPEIATLLAADAAELPYPAARTVDGLPCLRASLAKLAALRPKTALYCHAPATIGPQLIHDNLAYFDALEAACRAGLARGLDPARLDNAALANVFGCHYEEVAPQSGAWADVQEWYRGEGHAAQLRMMLDWLAQIPA